MPHLHSHTGLDTLYCIIVMELPVPRRQGPFIFEVQASRHHAESETFHALEWVGVASTAFADPI